MSKYDKVMLKTAFLFAEESYCKRKQVGAVLSSNGRIRSTGYNGTISGKPNNCEGEYYQCPHCESRGDSIDDIAEINSVKAPMSEDPFQRGMMQHRAYCKKCHSIIGESIGDEVKLKLEPKIITNDFTLHAEQNALTDAAKEGIKTDGATMYVTLSPCKQCAKLMVQSGIKRVVYSERYRNTEGIEFLEDCNVKVEQLNIKKYEGE